MIKQNNEEKKNKRLPAFYIALCCCVLMIGVAGFITEKHTEDANTVTVSDLSGGYEDASPVFSDELPESMSLALAAITPSPAPTPEPTPIVEEVSAPVDEVMEYAVDNPDVTGDAIMVTNDLPAFIMPVNGEILEPYTDVLSYNHALGDWRAHGGLDIAAAKGCSVASVASGEVERVYDNAMGTCVEISHPAGFVTRYMGLEAVENLTEGKEVQSGEVIGTTGDCAAENVEQPHLHFEMEKDGVPVNPADFLPH